MINPGYKLLLILNFVAATFNAESEPIESYIVKYNLSDPFQLILVKIEDEEGGEHWQLHNYSEKPNFDYVCQYFRTVIPDYHNMQINATNDQGVEHNLYIIGNAFHLYQVAGGF